MKKLLIVIGLLLWVVPTLAVPTVTVFVNTQNQPILNNLEQYQYILTFPEDESFGTALETRIMTEEEVEQAIQELDAKKLYWETVKADMLSQKANYQLIGP